MDYLTVINKENIIDNSFFSDLELVEGKDVLGETIQVEKATYEAFIALRGFLKTKGIFIDFDSGYRSIERQQEIIIDYTEKYGADYVKQYVAPIGTSEHHTGLAIDFSLVINGKPCMEIEDILSNENICLEVHKYLSAFGFILRYPKGKEHITGYSYEPWHIRYVGKEAADYIYQNNLTLEEYALEKKKQ